MFSLVTGNAISHDNRCFLESYGKFIVIENARKIRDVFICAMKIKDYVERKWNVCIEIKMKKIDLSDSNGR